MNLPPEIVDEDPADAVEVVLVVLLDDLVASNATVRG
jgi:hypothetical protein